MFDNSGIVKREKLFPRVGRVRDVNISPDGYVYISVEGEGIFKVLPKVNLMSQLLKEIKVYNW